VLSEAIAENRDLETLVNRSGRKGNVSETEFHVQLVASRSPVSASEVASLYSGAEPVSVIIEDGWYKYHLKTGNSYTRAQELKKNCNVAGAFIVAYVRGVKTNTYQAVNENQ